MEFLSNMNFNERDFTSFEETQTRLTVAQVKTKDYISLHTATYVYFNEDDMHLMMEIYPDVEELMDLLQDSLQQLSTWTEPNYIIQLFHHLFTLSLAKNVNVYDPLLYFLYKLEALLLITNDHIVWILCVFDRVGLGEEHHYLDAYGLSSPPSPSFFE